MSFTALVPENQPTEGSWLIIERLLRDRDGVWRQIKLEYRINLLIRQMLASSAIALACYGAIMGIGGSYGLPQAVSSAIKLPILFLLTLAICLPTLYLFNLLYGGRLSARQVRARALAAITVTSALTLAFAPITIFFLLTAPSYAFFKLLNVAILALTGLAGLRFLVSGMQGMNMLEYVEKATTNEEGEASPSPRVAGPRSVSMPLLQIWLLLFGFVGTQLGWTLRPFFGDPGRPFEIFRSIEGNFYTNIVQTIMQLLD